MSNIERLIEAHWERGYVWRGFLAAARDAAKDAFLCRLPDFSTDPLKAFPRTTVLALSAVCIVLFRRVELAFGFPILLIVTYWATYGRMPSEGRSATMRVKYEGREMDWAELPDAEKTKRLAVGLTGAIGLLLTGIFVSIWLLRSFGSAGWI